MDGACKPSTVYFIHQKSTIAQNDCITESRKTTKALLDATVLTWYYQGIIPQCGSHTAHPAARLRRVQFSSRLCVPQQSSTAHTRRGSVIQHGRPLLRPLIRHLYSDQAAVLSLCLTGAAACAHTRGSMSTATRAQQQAVRCFPQHALRILRCRASEVRIPNYTPNKASCALVHQQ